MQCSHSGAAVMPVLPVLSAAASAAAAAAAVAHQVAAAAAAAVAHRVAAAAAAAAITVVHDTWSDAMPAPYRRCTQCQQYCCTSHQQMPFTWQNPSARCFTFTNQVHPTQTTASDAHRKMQV